MTQTLVVPFHPVQPWRRRGRDALCALAVAAVLLGALAMVLASRPASADQAVDHVGRYVMDDSDAPGGPRFHPITVGHALSIGDDGEASVTLPFAFNYYGNDFSDITVGENGAITFPAGRQVPGINYRFTSITSNLVAPWWDDWDLGAHGQVLTGVSGQAPHRTFVVWWKDVAHSGSTAGDNRANFQVQLFEGSNKIEFHYLQTQVAASPYGQSGTVGLDNSNASILSYSFLQPQLRNRRAIRFVPATCNGLPANIVGSHGSDTITGTQSDDVILALDGDDQVNGLGGIDIVCAGRGDDVVQGGPGNDALLGGPGVDTLLGQTEDDLLRGGPGADHVAGGSGQDLCNGGAGRDTSSQCETKQAIP
jgi:Ca2+-binding RTX toxin-like protein